MSSLDSVGWDSSTSAWGSPLKFSLSLQFVTVLEWIHGIRRLLPHNFAVLSATRNTNSPLLWVIMSCLQVKMMELYECFLATRRGASQMGSSFSFGWVWEPYALLDCPCRNAWRCFCSKNAEGFFSLLGGMSEQARESSCGVSHFHVIRVEHEIYLR